MDIKNIYSKLELKNLNKEKKTSILKSCWEIPLNREIQVWGKFDSIVFKKDGENKSLYKIEDVRTINNNVVIEYPINDLDEREKIVTKGIYIPLSAGERLSKLLGENKYIRCSLILSDEKQMDYHNNPMLLNVNGASIKMLDTIPKEIFGFDELIEDEKNIHFDKNLLDFFISSNNKKIRKENKELKDILNKEYLKKKSTIENETFALDKLKSDKEHLIFELDENIEIINENINKKENDKSKLIKNIELLNDESSNLKNKIYILKDEYEKEYELMSKKLEKFRSFVKAKADSLLKLEFIEEDEYNEILMIRKKLEDEDDTIDFHNDLDGDFSSAISHIQAYLFNKDIMYPRYIIEDFFALVQTNDLIILAGESGSGKTNLIKSFADAVGGKSIIIPVKPNWTSSEDLLGYYNPLEKKYLSTPFLEALLEANRNPDIPYFICLDEMNLARVEYYFADFLSLLEERGELPEIHLYSDDESSHILSEFKNVLELIKSSQDKFKKGEVVNFVKILQDEEINNELKRVFGFSDKDSLIKYHSDLRRMLTGILNTPSSIMFPKNVRIIGAINIDETTHYLSPKILDRAHIMKFDSPLLFDWGTISNEIDGIENVDQKISFNIEDFGTRNSYPKFEMETEFSIQIINLTKQYFSKLGIEVGLRTIRQGLNYRKIFSQLNNEESEKIELLIMNNFIVHKILPKLVFDGSKKLGEVEKKDILLNFKSFLGESLNIEIEKHAGISSIFELDDILEKAKANDWIVNYWA